MVLEVVAVVVREVSSIPILGMSWVFFRTAVVAIPFVFSQPHFLVGAVGIMHFLDLFENLVDLFFHLSRVRKILPYHFDLLPWQHRPVHRGADDLLRLREVILQVDRTERLILPDGVEPSTWVIGQPVGHDAYTEQLLHGRLIFPAIEPPKRNLPTSVP